MAFLMFDDGRAGLDLVFNLINYFFIFSDSQQKSPKHFATIFPSAQLYTGCSLNFVFFLIIMFWFFRTLQVLLQCWCFTSHFVHTTGVREENESLRLLTCFSGKGMGKKSNATSSFELTHDKIRCGPQNDQYSN